MSISISGGANASSEEGGQTLVESWLRNEANGVVSRIYTKPEAYCDKFLSLNPGRQLQCSVVRYPDGLAVVVLDEPDLTVVAKSPTREAERCDKAFSDSVALLQKRLFAIPISDQVNRRSMDTDFRTIAEEKGQRLWTYLEPDNCGATRRSAATLLHYTNLCLTHLETALPLLLDPDRVVRNGVGQCMHLTVVNLDTSDRIRVVDSAFRLAELPSHTDRNKALGIIHNATQGNSAIAKYIGAKYSDQLRKIAKKSVLPNVGGLAARILEIVAEK